MLQPSTSTVAVVVAGQPSAQEKKLELVDKVVKNITHEGNVLREIFSKDRAHTQLVQRSEQVLRLLMARGALSDADRELVWATGEQDDGPRRVEVQKQLMGAAGDMESRDREFFIEKIERVPADGWTDRDIELVVAICQSMRVPEAEPELVERGLRFLWGVAMESGPSCDLMCVNRAALGFAAILKR